MNSTLSECKAVKSSTERLTIGVLKPLKMLRYLINVFITKCRSMNFIFVDVSINGMPEDEGSLLRENLIAS